MGSSKGHASGDRREHRKAAVIRREAHAKDVADIFLKRAVAEKEAFEAPRVFMVDTPTGPHAQFGCVLVETPAEPRPTSEERADANRHLIGAIAFVIVAGLILVLVLGVGLLVVARGG